MLKPTFNTEVFSFFETLYNKIALFLLQLQFSIQFGYNDLDCGVERERQGVYSNDVVIQHHDRIGMISHKKSLITIFGHKHKITNFIKKLDIFHQKFSTAFNFGLYLE